ncbi:TPA: redox-regulated ATPase YchF [Candidatus Dependentiae bacterium]|nr:MAG: GTP-binding protein YchF [candidate division TM6 bacterium GW2011_GWF2_43_87]HBL98695.1 redox-regulated ATPase YchF [Candidatus Dependentiae bacterium]
MSIAAGLVGLPNVGKSTLFNALTKSSVPAENYPFCTIDPHKAITTVNDNRMPRLQKLFNSQRLIPATTQFVDIAGLVKGAAEGEGLGNQFLSHIREVNLILHVLRCFEDENITHTTNTIDPIADFETIVTELGLKDLESLEKRLQKIDQLLKASKSNPAQEKLLHQERQLSETIKNAINQSNWQDVRDLTASATCELIPLLCAKNYLIIANIAEHEIADDGYKQNPHYQSLVNKFGIERVIPICARAEYELSQLSDEESAEFMAMMGLKKSGLQTIIEKTYENLGLITFFTCGPQEIHAWPIKKGISVRQASGEIHSDLERGFICSEIYNCEDLFKTNSINALRDQGKIRTEGQNYIVQDGDIILVKFNV